MPCQFLSGRIYLRAISFKVRWGEMKDSSSSYNDISEGVKGELPLVVANRKRA